ncbi:MAG: SPASM domain-containing protein [Candidatus Heimdallarchaeaceae archaeon]
MLNLENTNILIFSYNGKSYLYTPETRFFWRISNSELCSEKKRFLSLKDLKEYYSEKEYQNILTQMGLLKKRKFIVETEKERASFDKEIVTFDHLVINPSNECNLNCWFCYARNERKKENEKLDVERAKEIIIHFADLKRKAKSETALGISFFYTSEITLNFEYFNEMVLFIEQIKNKYSFPIYYFLPSTNFFSPKQSFIDFVNKYGFLTVTLDIENEKVRRRVIDNLSLVKKNVVKHLIIPVHPNIEDLFFLYSYYSDYFDYVSLRLLRIDNNHYRAWDKRKLDSFLKRVEDLVDHLLNLNEGELLSFLKKIGPTDYISRYLNRLLSREKLITRCPAGKTALSLSPNSEIYPCSSLIGNKKFKLGEWKKNLSMKDLDNDVVKLVDLIQECSSCPIRYICGGPCVDWKEKQAVEGDVNKIECGLNIRLVELLIYFIDTVKERFPLFFDKYEKEKKVKNKINYSLDINQFVDFFM